MVRHRLVLDSRPDVEGVELWTRQIFGPALILERLADGFLLQKHPCDVDYEQPLAVCLAGFLLIHYFLFLPIRYCCLTIYNC